MPDPLEQAARPDKGEPPHFLQSRARAAFQIVIHVEGEIAARDEELLVVK